MHSDRVFDFAEIVHHQLERRAHSRGNRVDQGPTIHCERWRVFIIRGRFDPDRSRCFRASVARNACLHFWGAGAFPLSLGSERPAVIWTNKAVVLNFPQRKTRSPMQAKVAPRVNLLAHAP